MSNFVLHTRSFHPDRNFGMGGLGFEGDNRSFSMSEDVTSRIFHKLPINLAEAQFGKIICDSSSSSNTILPRLLEGRFGEAQDRMIRDEFADQGIQEPAYARQYRARYTLRDWIPPMHNGYTEARKKQRHNLKRDCHALTCRR